VADWTISRRGDEPRDFWSQSMCWGTADFSESKLQSVRVRFHNTGRRNVARAEAHLVYRTASSDATRVTFDWTDDSGPHQVVHDFASAAAPWKIATGKDVQTRWVQFEPVPGK
jgi:hypothetical protein